MLIHDAASAFTAVIGAAFAWVETIAITGAFVLAVIGLSAAPLFAPTTRRRFRRPAASARRRVPTWAHTQPYDYEEAA